MSQVEYKSSVCQSRRRGSETDAATKQHGKDVASTAMRHRNDLPFGAFAWLGLRIRATSQSASKGRPSWITRTTGLGATAIGLGVGAALWMGNLEDFTSSSEALVGSPVLAAVDEVEALTQYSVPKGFGPNGYEPDGYDPDSWGPLPMEPLAASMSDPSLTHWIASAKGRGPAEQIEPATVSAEEVKLAWHQAWSRLTVHAPQKLKKIPSHRFGDALAFGRNPHPPLRLAALSGEVATSRYRAAAPRYRKIGTRPTRHDGLTHQLKLAMASTWPSGEARQELECLAQNIYFEARSEPVRGQIAVAHVVLNRVSAERFPNTICEVVKQGGEIRRHQCQFSWWCDGKSDKTTDRSAWIGALKLAREIYGRRSEDPTGGALWYHADYVYPSWRHQFVTGPKIGRHIFYSQKPNQVTLNTGAQAVPESFPPIPPMAHRPARIGPQLASRQ
ncbi:MAG: cell wall hydrolase [Pseudomonadota bacterium]